ncbi:MAG: hypothetical protein JWP11_1713 [Frankiales bacterium]|nr:hypothetical protein [Frankiales bacterium]
MTLSEHRTTVIRRTVVDPASLHGLLQSLRDLHLRLVSVTQPQDVPDADETDGVPTTDPAQPRPINRAREDLR